MSEPGTEAEKTLDTRPTAPRKFRARRRWRRNTVIALIGVPVLLAGLTAGGFGLYTWSDGSDLRPGEFQPDGAGVGGAYYRVRVDYLPRQTGDPGATGRGWVRGFGATLFDEGLTTAIAIDVTHGQGPVEQLARWRGDRKASVMGPLIAYQKQNQATVAVTVTPMAQPRLRWDIDVPQWVGKILGGLVPRAGGQQPPPIQLAPPTTGRQAAKTMIVVRNYKGTAIGDLRVTARWRESALFEPALVQTGPTPNPAIELVIAGDAAARKSAVLRMVRATVYDDTKVAAITAWIERRFAALPGNPAQCAQTFDAARGRFALSTGDAALLAYFAHRDGPAFSDPLSLDTVCGRKALGAALRRIGAPPAAIRRPPVAVQVAAAAAVVKTPPAPRLRPAQILRRLAREWKAGLATRTASTRFIRADAKLVQPNRFNLVRAAPLVGRAAILNEQAANPVRHFACFTGLADNAMSAIVERRQGAATAVFRYRFFFDRENRIKRILRRPAILADLNELKRSQPDTACADRFPASEEARLRQAIGGDGFVKAPPPVTPAARLVIESTLNWKSPPPRGRARNRISVDLRVLDSIRRSTSPRGGG